MGIQFVFVAVENHSRHCWEVWRDEISTGRRADVPSASGRTYQEALDCIRRLPDHWRQ